VVGAGVRSRRGAGIVTVDDGSDPTRAGRRAAAGLEALEARVRCACERAGRPPDSVALVGASKRQPVESTRAVYDAGLRRFGENRVQEAEA
jgi:uncharacterized pyridoxal phosphate-containing UPF0001 family protein